MRSLRKQPVASYSPYDFKREPGDRVYDPQPALGGAYIYDLVESSGRNKRDAGELSRRVVKKNGVERLAIFDGQKWFWAD